MSHEPSNGLTVFLGLIAVLSGGCSVLLMPLVSDLGGEGGIIYIWLSGFAISALCIWGISRVRNKK